MTCYRRMLRVITTQDQLIYFGRNGRAESVTLNIVKCRKLRYFGQVVTAHNLCTSILHGHIDGRASRTWTDDIREWTGMTIVECVRTAEDRVARRAVTCSSDL